MANLRTMTPLEIIQFGINHIRVKGDLYRIQAGVDGNFIAVSVETGDSIKIQVSQVDEFISI